MNDFLAFSRFHIRWMLRVDMPRILEIEKESFDQAWNEQEFLSVLKKKDCIGMVCVINRGSEDEKIVGFTLYELHTTRIELLSLAIAKDHRREGAGQKMTDWLKSKLSVTRRNRIVLCVRETNLSAQLFFQKQKFKATKVVRKHYKNSDEDGFVMCYCHPSTVPQENQIFEKQRAA